MTKDEAKRLVVLGTAGTVALTFAGTIKDGDLPPAAVGVGGTVAGVMLAGLAEVWPDGAGAIAATMFVTAALVFGKPAWEGIATATGRDGPLLPSRSVGQLLPGTIGAGTGANQAPEAPPAPISHQAPRFGVPTT